ncbi:MAG: DUF2079 domain-containing protein [Pegethrix bostrychoides GSE-TBD4-15B]|jgi:uncharacterized membrane protein|uniref:DUF2079 domain-containing protein n=1 Tax=Pegethrix bostrychoides GSE-TBD4-15B TaxID=2839662 RepID=A0A951P9Y5_9CYAN|nr:DUF2079 domain-containing protein [Pegethrix bostrychoides GSE-TBD4-15B]
MSDLSSFSETASDQPSPDGSDFKSRFKAIRSHVLSRWILLATVILFAASAIRHLMLISTGFDLGIYDQVAYLLSRGKAPISSYLGFHHLGNHAAYSFYLLAIPYAIYPSVYWLFGVQAVCLALGAWPTWMLARQAGLSQALASAMAAVYLLHPIVFNVNMFDFHPEVMALPVLLLLLWLARAEDLPPLRRKLWFGVALIFVLGCKASLSITVAAMGFWLLLFEKRRFVGGLALLGGTAWFLLATQWIIPGLSGAEAAALGRYKELGGDSVLGVAKNLLLNPGFLLQKVFTRASLQYLGLLFLPFVWGLSPRHLKPLVVTIPLIVINILSANGAQRDLVHQYSLPILPFLLLAVIDSLAHGQGLLRQRRWIIVWALLVFLALAKYGRYYPEYAANLSTWQASREALALVSPQAGVITDNWHAAQLSHREQITLLRGNRSFQADLPQSDYVLINVTHPWDDDFETTNRMFERFKKRPELQISYQRDGVYLFTRKPS